MHLQESGEMYLETIYVLARKSGAVRSLDVATYMNFSKPSISRAMSLLREDGYIETDAKGYITLTDKGEKEALRVYERHEWLRKFFVSIGVSEETAAIDACRIEHVISAETFGKMKESLSE